MRLPDLLYLLSKLLPAHPLKALLRLWTRSLVSRLGLLGGRLSYYESGRAVFAFTRPPLRGDTIVFPFNREVSRTCLFFWQEDYYYFVRYPVEPGSMVIDGGSFPGDFAVLAARRVGADGQVFAFEPAPPNRRYLERVIAANGLQDRVQIIPYALAGSCGQCHLDLKLGESKLVDYATDTVVDTITLDGFLEGKGLLEADREIFVKLDIEGSEVEVLRATPRTLSEPKVKFAIGAYHVVGGRQTAVVLEAMFDQLGYCTTRAGGHHLTLLAGRHPPPPRP